MCSLHTKLRTLGDGNVLDLHLEPTLLCSLLFFSFLIQSVLFPYRDDNHCDGLSLLPLPQAYKNRGGGQAYKNRGGGQAYKNRLN